MSQVSLRGALRLVVAEDAVDRVSQENLEVVDHSEAGRGDFSVPVIEGDGTRMVTFRRNQEGLEPGCREPCFCLLGFHACATLLLTPRYRLGLPQGSYAAGALHLIRSQGRRIAAQSCPNCGAACPHEADLDPKRGDKRGFSPVAPASRCATRSEAFEGFVAIEGNIEYFLSPSWPGFVEGSSGPRRGADLFVRNPGLGPCLDVYKSRPGGAALITARLTEYTDEIAIERVRSVVMPSRDFAYDRRLRTAEVAPPAPFAGSARFDLDKKAGRRWSGDLTVDMPGRTDVSLTGPLLRATLTGLRERGPRSTGPP